MNKAILIASATLLLSIGSEASEMARIRSKHIIASHELGRVTLRHDGSSFAVQQGKVSHKVASYDIDPILRQLNKQNLAYFLKSGRISVSKLSDGSFALRSHIDGLGGGAWGAYIGCFLGKGLVHGAFHGSVAVITLVATPFITPAGAGALAATIEATCIGPVEIFSNYVAIAGGIAGAAATGPV